MKITIKALDNNDKIYAEVIRDTLEHPTMMWIRRFIWETVTCNEDKVRLDIEWTIGSTHMEITHSDKWYLTYVEDEFFCDSIIEFDSRGETQKFINDILKNLEQTEKAERAWA